ncbi:MAG TPA: FliA/WhiG family RNA polymerase sigma factor [Bacillaceae bacterium]
MTHSAPVEERLYWEKWSRTRDADAGDVLAKKYMPLVTYHVQRISVGLPRNVSREELKSLGLMGLLDALNKFDYSRDLKFDTYASFRIRGAIIDGLRKEDWLPRSTREKAKKIEAAIEKLEQENMRHPAPEEIAGELGLTPDEVCQTMNEHFFANVLSMDEYIHDQDEGENHSHLIKDERVPSPDEQVVHKERIEEMTEIISTLSEKEQLVLALFYKEEMTFTEIGEIAQLSTSRISQIHSKALLKLRSALLKKDGTGGRP